MHNFVLRVHEINVDAGRRAFQSMSVGGRSPTLDGNEIDGNRRSDVLTFQPKNRMSAESFASQEDRQSQTQCFASQSIRFLTYLACPTNFVCHLEHPCRSVPDGREECTSSVRRSVHRRPAKKRCRVAAAALVFHSCACNERQTNMANDVEIGVVGRNGCQADPRPNNNQIVSKNKSYANKSADRIHRSPRMNASDYCQFIE